MHELSIVRSLIDVITAHTPRGAAVELVQVRVGALQAIEPQAMQWAWSAATRQTSLDGCVLQLQLLPWRMHCHECGRTWESDDPLVHCACGCQHPHPSGSDELTLISLRVDEPLSHAERIPPPTPNPDDQENPS